MTSLCSLWGWAEKFIGWLWCNGRIFFFCVTKCGLFFNIVSPVVHALLPSLLQCLDSLGIEALILILKKVPKLQIWPHYIIGPILLPSKVFFHVGEQKIVRSTLFVRTQDSLCQCSRPSPKFLWYYFSKSWST